jgi:hypothetical protein
MLSSARFLSGAGQICYAVKRVLSAGDLLEPGRRARGACRGGEVR